MLAFGAVLPGRLSAGGCNDAADAQRDMARGRLDKPVATGELTARTVAGAAGVNVASVLPDVENDLATGVGGLP